MRKTLPSVILMTLILRGGEGDGTDTDLQPDEQMYLIDRARSQVGFPRRMGQILMTTPAPPLMYFSGYRDLISAMW